MGTFTSFASASSAVWVRDHQQHDRLGLPVILVYNMSIYVHILGFLGLGMVATFLSALAPAPLVRGRSDYLQNVWDMSHDIPWTLAHTRSHSFTKSYQVNPRPSLREVKIRGLQQCYKRTSWYGLLLT